MKVSLAIIVVALGVVGCSTLKTRDLSKASKVSENNRTGIAYFLPLGKLHIAAAKVTTLKTNVPPETESQLRTTEKSITKTLTNPLPQGVEISKTIDSAYSTNLLQSQAVIIPRTVYNVTVEEVYERDPERLFLLSARMSPFADDTFHIGLTNGLLHSIATTNVDRTGEVILKLGQIGIEAFKIAAGVPIPSGKVDVPPAELPDKIDLVFDPFQSDELDNANRIFEPAGIAIHMNGKSPLPRLREVGNSKEKVQTSAGFFYRPLIPYSLVLSNALERRSKTVLLPNEAPIFIYNSRRSLFGTKSAQVVLQHGVITEVRTYKQSEVAGFIDIPLSLVRSVVALPSELVQLKVNYSNTNAALIKSQQATIDALLARLQSERKYLDALSATNSPDTGSGSTE
jgi:hypothetical protein